MKSKVSKLVLAGSGALLSAALMAGCGTISSTTSANAQATHRAASTSSAPPLIMAGDFANPTMTENFNPLSVNALYGTNLVYEPLYVINRINGAQTPWLATSYKWVNNLTLEFTIRSGVKFNNGTPFSPSDVVYTFNLMKKYPALDQNDVWASLASVTSSGNKVIFKFSKVDIPEFYYIATQPIVDEAQFSKVKDPVTFTNPDPIGTGPFMVQSFTGEQYDLKPNPYYWQRSKVKIPEIEIRGVTGNTSVDEWLVDGSVDWAQSFIPNMTKVYIDRNPKYYHAFQPPSSPWTIFMNLTKAPFNNVDFRKALAYSIQRTQIVSKAEYGIMTPDYGSLLPPTMGQWLSPQISKEYKYTYNLKLAAEYLKKAGLKKNSQGQWVEKNGTPISLTLEVPAGWTDIIQDGQIMVNDWKKLGLNVTEITPSPTTDVDNLQTGHFDMALMEAVGVPNPYFVYYSELDSNETAPIGQVAPSNYERWRNPATDKLLNEFAATTNVAKQKQIMYQLQKLVATDLPVIPYDFGVFWGEYTTLHYTGWPSYKDPYAPMQIYAYPDPLLIVTHLRPVK
ncbi:MAG: ABC transporter substrate-binding protein [Firmicutes bacterium]|nr:ABC transporter substrate-binding protein [Bacillota bacterium]